MSEMRVLIVDDNRELASSLSDFLEEFGYTIDFAYNGQACLSLVTENEYDVIVLDVSMPGLDGLQTCQFLRTGLHTSVPVIFLTARDTLQDKVAGFNVGGDDYLVKPFAAEELHCRIKALVSRGSRKDIGVQVIGELEIDHNLNQVKRQGQIISLTGNQLGLLKALAKVSPEPVSRGTLEQAMWQDGVPDSEPLRTQIYRLRSALDKNFEYSLIETVYGKGYRLVAVN